ncbi:protein phosphatase 2C domain-containing protein, partial [Streptomyces griseoincarnatus]
MSQQGGRPGGPTGPGPEDDWWGQLYDDASDDTGPAPAADSLDDRFASAAGAVGGDGPPTPSAPDPRDVPGPPVLPRPRRTSPPSPKAAPPDTGGAPPRAWWEPEPSTDTPPVSVPPERPGPADALPATEPSDAPAAPPEPPSTRPTAPAPNPPSGPEPSPGQASAYPRGPGRPVVPPSVPEVSPARHPATEPSRPDDRAAASEANPSAPDAPALPGRPPPSGPTAAPAYGDWTPAAPSDGEPADASPASRLGPLPPPLPSRVHVGTRPPTYDAEPTALPAADPDDLDALVPDTVLDGARYGACTLRAVSVRGDSARYRGEPRRDALLTARFGSGERALVLVALATGTRTAPGVHLAAAEVCRWIAAAVGRSHERLAADIRAARRTDLKAGLHRLTDRVLGKLHAAATEQGLDPDDYAASMRCLLLSGDPECRTRVFFGVGPGGLFRLREREWQDIEPEVA